MHWILGNALELVTLWSVMKNALGSANPRMESGIIIIRCLNFTSVFNNLLDVNVEKWGTGYEFLTINFEGVPHVLSVQTHNTTKA